MKKLKIWNGRGLGRYEKQHLYVAAYSVNQCIELVNKTLGFDGLTRSEVTVYWSKGSWGNTMDGIEPVEPCVYVSDKYDKNPTRLI